MKAQQRVAVAGATGRVGRHVVDLLETEGQEVVAISRATGVDLITGDGLSDALDGVTSIVDAATGPSPDEEAAAEFFLTATRNLQEYGERPASGGSSSSRSSAPTTSRPATGRRRSPTSAPRWRDRSRSGSCAPPSSTSSSRSSSTGAGTAM